MHGRNVAKNAALFGHLGLSAGRFFLGSVVESSIGEGYAEAELTGNKDAHGIIVPQR